MTNVNFTAWETLFDKQALATLENAYSIQEEAVQELKNRVQKRTPEGKPELWNYPAPKNYVPGTLRASWEMGKTAKGQYQLYNSQPYAERVEYGWSTQAPNGMLRISLLEWSSIVDKTASRGRK